MISNEYIDAIFDRELTVDDLFNDAPFPMALANDKGYLTKVNNSWERITGFSKKEITTTHFMDFVHNDDKIKTLRVYGSSDSFDKDKDKEPIIGFINRYKCKDGRYAILEWYSTGKVIKNNNSLSIAIFRGYE